MLNKLSFVPSQPSSFYTAICISKELLQDGRCNEDKIDQSSILNEFDANGWMLFYDSYLFSIVYFLKYRHAIHSISKANSVINDCQPRAFQGFLFPFHLIFFFFKHCISFSHYLHSGTRNLDVYK